MQGAGVLCAGASFIFMNVFKKHAASLAKLEVYYGDGVSMMDWGGLAGLPCLASSDTEGADLGLGGLGLTADVKIVVRTALFGDPTDGPVALPKATQTVKFYRTAQTPARALRIELLVEASDQFLVLHCSDPTKGVVK